MTMFRSRLPLFYEFTPLNKIPREWMQDIEPLIVRDIPDWPGCWIWQGVRDAKGHPIITFTDYATKKRRMVRAARMVMKIFYEFEDHLDVVHSCGNFSCLNPHHLKISDQHWSQR